LFTFCLQNIIKKTPTINPWENYYSRPSFTKSTSLPTTIVEKKKNEWCYLLLTYVLHCKKRKKKNKAKSTKQTLSRLSCQTDWPHQFCVSAQFSIEAANIF